MLTITIFPLTFLLLDYSDYAYDVYLELSFIKFKFLFYWSYLTRSKNMTTIKIDKDIITLINVFTVDPGQNNNILVDALVETTKASMASAGWIRYLQVYIRARI